MENSLITEKFNQQGKEKKAYESPQLWAYGNICEITKAVGKNGANDTGGSPPNVKTSA